jgi:hypothetical protein
MGRWRRGIGSRKIEEICHPPAHEVGGSSFLFSGGSRQAKQGKMSVFRYLLPENGGVGL